MAMIFQRIYERIMIILVMLTIMTIWTENSYNSIVNWTVWFIFFVDFIVRFVLSENKWDFIKQNPFLIVAVIPFDQFFQMARIVRIIYLFRIKTITKYYITPYVHKLTYQSKVFIFGGLIAFLIGESAVIWMMEANVGSFWQSVQYLTRHLMFFGHHSFEVQHQLTLWFFVVTSIIGVILHGLALQWLFTKAENMYSRYRNKPEKVMKS